MSGTAAHKKSCDCRDCRVAEAKAAKARKQARAAVAAETGKRMAQRHVLDLGDRAVEVISDRPGVWRVVQDGRAGMEIAPADISWMLETDREIKSRRGKAASQADEITSALGQGDPAAAIMLELSGPLGLSAAELERLVPDRAPGTCVSCRLPLSPGDGTVTCAWCAALHDLAPRPRIRAMSQEEAPAAWSCTCGCPDQRAHQRRIGVRPARRRSVLAPVLLLTWAVIFYRLAYHVYFPFIIPAVTTFIAFLMSTARRH